LTTSTFCDSCGIVKKDGEEGWEVVGPLDMCQDCFDNFLLSNSKFSKKWKTYKEIWLKKIKTGETGMKVDLRILPKEEEDKPHE